MNPPSGRGAGSGDVVTVDDVAVNMALRDAELCSSGAILAELCSTKNAARCCLIAAVTGMCYCDPIVIPDCDTIVFLCFKILIVLPA